MFAGFDLLIHSNDKLASNQEEIWMIAGLCLIALLLGRAAYTDIFKDHIIENKVNLAILLVALPVFFLTYPINQLLAILIIAGFLLFLVFIGATAEGDLKLYFALSFVLSWASFLMIFLSWIIIIIYALPIAVKTARSKSELKEKPQFGHRLGKAPGAPGIAGAFLIAVGILAGPGLFIAMTVLFLVSFALNYFFEKKTKTTA